MQKQIWEALETPKFEKDHNFKDYARWEDLKLRDVALFLLCWKNWVEGYKRYLSLKGKRNNV
jgi:hypothetical protein